MQPDQNNNRNTFIFIAAALALFLVYDFLVLRPANEKAQQQAKAAQAAQERGAARTGAAGAPPTVTLSRDQAAAASPRVAIDTPSLRGSISLRGARLDDLLLKRYHATVQPSSPNVELFRPEGAPNAYFADVGWTGANLPGLPDANTQWTAQAGARLTPTTPIVLTYRSPQGLDFTRTIAVDRDYMFTVTDTVANRGSGQVTIAPYATVQRHGLPTELGKVVNAHQGGVGWLGERLKILNYKAWKKAGQQDLASTGGWLGVTDKYWLAAIIPDQRQTVRGTFRVTPSPAGDIYDASYLGGYVNIAPGKQSSVTTRLFAGAKVYPVLRNYEYSQDPPQLFGLTHAHTAQPTDIKNFDLAIDWGRLWFLTRPIFWVLENFYHLVGDFGVAILLLTVVVRLAFFWPSQKSYESMTKMKKVQPDVEKLRKRHKDDPAKQQQEMMALYQREKINPFLGCLPMLATIPVFLALFKVLSVTIEMRHAHFLGFVRDLSDRDPTTVWNLFGLIPWNPAMAPLVGGFLDGGLHIGIWAMAYGLTMWLTQAMSPQTGMDPTQQKIMQFFPLIFTFVLAQFAVGLLVYYTWSNILGSIQQYVIMRRLKVDNPIDQIIRRLRGKTADAGPG